MANIPDVNFNKIPDKSVKFNQTEYYESNFDKINQQIVPKVNELDAQLADIEKEALYPAENLVENGNFDSTTGWQALSSTQAVANNVLTLTGTGAGALVGVRRSKGLRVGHKYYAKAQFRYLGVDVPTYRVRIGGGSEIVEVENLGDFFDYDVIVSTPNDNTALYFQAEATFASAAAASGKQLEIQKFICIDLTDAFGAGNEPTKEEIKLYLSKFENGWFDGIASLTDTYTSLEVKEARLDKVNNLSYDNIGKRFEYVESKSNSNTPNDIKIIKDVIMKSLTESNSEIVYTGAWSQSTVDPAIGDGVKVSNTAGNTAVLNFYGDYVALWLLRSNYAGIADIYIDDIKVKTIDCYIAGATQITFPAIEKKLAYGEHQIKVVVTGTKNASSGGAYIYLDHILTQETIKTETKSFQPGIILTFDDSREYVTQSAPILANYGFKATCYVNPSIFDKIDALYPTMAFNIPLVKTFGWEVTSHGYLHSSLSAMTLAEAEDSILKSLRWLKSRGLESTHFSAPYGQINADVLELIRKYHASNVMVGTTPVSFNPRNFDPYQIPRYQLQQDTVTSTLSTFLDTVKSKNETVVLCFHGVTAGATGVNMTPEKLTEILDIIASKDMPVMRMKDFFGA